MVSLFLIIGFVSWPGMVRMVRGQVLEVKDWTIHRGLTGTRSIESSRLIWHSMLPNFCSTIIVLAAMNTANTISAGGGVGYLGVGVPEPAATWGGMIADGQPYFVTAPHIVIVPGIAILVTVLALNLSAKDCRKQPRRDADDSERARFPIALLVCTSIALGAAGSESTRRRLPSAAACCDWTCRRISVHSIQRPSTAQFEGIVGYMVYRSLLDYDQTKTSFP